MRLGRRQGARGDQETSHRHQSPPEPRQDGTRIGPRRHQHRPRAQHPLGRPQLPRPLIPRQRGDRRILHHHRPAPDGGLGQSGNEPPHMHHRAALLQHPAMKRLRPDLAPQVPAGQHLRLGIDLGMNRLEIPRDPVVMRGLRCQLQFPRQTEIAIDPLFRDDGADRVDALVKGAIHRLRPLRAKGRPRRQIGMRQPVVQMPAIPPRCAEPHMPRLQHRHAAPRHRQPPRRAKASEPAPDHGHIHRPLRQRRPPGKGGRAVMPVRRKPHRHSPNTPGKPPISAISVYP